MMPPTGDLLCPPPHWCATFVKKQKKLFCKVNRLKKRQTEINKMPKVLIKTNNNDFLCGTPYTDNWTLALIKEKRERCCGAWAGQKEAEGIRWKGFVLKLLTDFVWTRHTTETAMKHLDQAFVGILCSDSRTVVDDLQLGNIKVPFPV